MVLSMLISAKSSSFSCLVRSYRHRMPFLLSKASGLMAVLILTLSLLGCYFPPLLCLATPAFSVFIMEPKNIMIAYER